MFILQQCIILPINSVFLSPTRDVFWENNFLSDVKIVDYVIIFIIYPLNNLIIQYSGYPRILYLWQSFVAGDKLMMTIDGDKKNTDYWAIVNNRPTGKDYAASCT